MGRSLTYRNGPVRLWAGDVNSDQNSQQISDPYTFSHVIHGALFYGLTHAGHGPASLGCARLWPWRIEATWEVYENTDTVINRYRAATIALGYYGDSVTELDVPTFWRAARLRADASRLRWWWTVSWVVAMEIVLAVDHPRQPHAEHHHADLARSRRSSSGSWALINAAQLTQLQLTPTAIPLGVELGVVGIGSSALGVTRALC